MRKIFQILLLCILLSGCGPAHSRERPTLPVQTEPAPTPSASIPEVSRNEGTQGSILTYRLPVSDITGIRCWDDHLLVFSGKKATTLTVFTGEALVQGESLHLDFLLSPQDDSLCFHGETLSFFDPNHHQTLVLDQSLAVTRRLAAPAELVGTPLLSPDQKTLYYCSDAFLRAWDLDSGVRRTVKELRYPEQTMSGITQNGSVLLCRVRDSGGTFCLVLDASTGRLLSRQKGDFTLQWDGSSYYAVYSAGTLQTLLYNGSDAQPRQLLPKDLSASSLFLPKSRGAVSVWQGKEGSFCLTYYDLASGREGSSLLLDNQTAPLLCTNGADNVFILLNDSTLCRWLLPPFTPKGSKSFSHPYSGAGNGDEKSLALCADYAQTLGEKYGIEILVGTDAVQTPPWDYCLEPETADYILWRVLDELDSWLSVYPASLIQDTAAHFSSFKLCLVRSLTGAAGKSSLSNAAGIQYFQGDTAYLALGIGKYARSTLYHEFYHAMQTHLLTHSTALDSWQELNPSGFFYDLDYTANAARDAGVYMIKGSRAFIDTYSMSFPKEDQARVLEYAMLPGNQALFEEPILQEKLACLCAAIREAYRLQDASEVFLWEQYLKKPLAPSTN